jgi:hypothetical protein
MFDSCLNPVALEGLEEFRPAREERFRERRGTTAPNVPGGVQKRGNEVSKERSSQFYIFSGYYGLCLSKTSFDEVIV